MQCGVSENSNLAQADMRSAIRVNLNVNMDVHKIPRLFAGEIGSFN